MQTLIIGKRVLLPTEEISNGAVLVENGKIIGVFREIPKGNDYEILDYSNCTLSPGFIDVHVHGANGFDAIDGTYESINGISNFLATTGTTGFLATTLTVSHEEIVNSIMAVKEAKEKGVTGAALLGAHLEGPYVNMEKKGAQNGEYVRNPDPVELQSYIDILGEDFKLITLAPELDENFKTVRLARQAGAVVSAGHSCASYETAIQSFDAGVTHATHLFNGMDPMHHRNPGLVGASLVDKRVSVEMIADLIHLHPGTMRVVLEAKGSNGVTLVTDCMRAGNLPDGQYDLGGLAVSVTDGIARTESGGLAGSTLRMITAVKNITEKCNLPLYLSANLASLNPAKEIGLVEKKGSLEVGKDADITAFDDEFNVMLTMVDGNIVFKS